MPKSKKQNIIAKPKGKNNKTKKTRRCYTDDQLSLYWSKPLHTFRSFEDAYVKTSSFRLSKYHTNVEKMLKSLFSKPFSPKTIRPQDDFYSHVNYTWIKHEQLKQSEKYIIEVDNFRITQFKVYNELLEIIKEFIKKDHHSRKAK